MLSTRAAGRWIGAGVLVGYAADVISNFFLQPSIRTGAGTLGLFQGAVSQPEKIGAIVLVGVLSGFVALAMAGLLCRTTSARPVFWLALTYLGVKAAALGMGGLEFASLQMLRSVGEAVVHQPPGQAAGLADPLQLMILSLRDGVHFPHMMTGGFSAFLLYVILMSAGFIPRFLGVLGLIASASQMAGVFTGVLGYDVHMAFLLPLFAMHLLLGLWLVVLGFRERTAP